MDHTKALHHRGYALSLRPLEGGWDVHIGDPAGHVADVDLHCQLSQGPWPSPESALEAARSCIDALLGEESSY
ncbi:MAG: hypothetical protein WBM08_02105 [Prochlorococcaceae cyanobacterium]